VSVSQDALEAADHVKVPPPELETTTLCDAGAAPPIAYEK
jgi:hypothetical protein